MAVVSRTSTPVTDKTFGMAPMASKGQRENFTLAEGSVPETEAALAAAVRDLFSQGREGRRTRVAQWNRNAEVLSNRTWLASRPRWMPTPEVPEIYPILASIVGWVTDTRPTFDCVPFTAPGSPYYDFWLALADDLTTVVSSAFIGQTQERQLELATWDAYTLGTGIIKTVWDQSLDGGLGNVSQTRVNPYHFYPDPHASTTEDGSFYIEVRTMSLQELDRRYPGAAKNTAALLPGAQEGIDRPPSPDDPQVTLPMANPGAIGSGSGSYGLPGQSRDKVDPVRAQPVTVFECWMREHVHMPNEAEESTYATTTEEMWRCVVVAGNRVLLDDTAENLFGHNWHPYDRFVPHETGHFWGRSMVEDLTPSQIAINRSLAAIQQNLELTGNPILKDNVRSLLHRVPITNRPGSRVQVGDGGDIDWLEPPTVAEAHKWLIEFHLSEMEKISGLSAMTRGTVPTGRNSTDVMNAVQESSFVRIRLALRNMEYCLRSAFTKYAQLVVRNFSVPRTVAVVGPTGERTTLALRSRHFMTQTEQGAIPLKFQLNINAGSQQPISPQAMAEKANFLFTAGAIDEIALLQAHRWPHYQEVYQRVMAQREAMLNAGAQPK